MQKHQQKFEIFETYIHDFFGQEYYIYPIVTNNAPMKRG